MECAYRAAAGVVRRDHRIFPGKAIFFAVLLTIQTLHSREMPLGPVINGLYVGGGPQLHGRKVGVSDKSSFRTGWYVQLNGHLADLAVWRDQLTHDSEPYAVQFRDDSPSTYLWSSEFQDLAGPEEVLACARPMVETLNGLLALHSLAEELAVGSALYVSRDGSHHSYLFFEEKIAIRDHVAIGVVDEQGRVVSVQTPQAALGHRKLAAANKDAAALLAHFGNARRGDWFELYKTLEMAEKLVGGEKALRRQLPDLPLKRIRTAANYHRHAPLGTKAYNNSAGITVEEAVRALPKIVRHALQHIADGSGSSLV